VHWGSRSLDRIQALIVNAPRGGVAHLLRLMAQDWRGTKDGFPDLMLIEDGRVRFVEIKTAGDSLRRNQLTRLRQISQAGFPVQIVKVRWAVDPLQPYVVVDIETTGGNNSYNRITEIGMVKLIAGEEVDRYQTLINPQRRIPANITRLTGISDDMVEDAPIFADVASEIAAFTEDAVFVAHNVNFDYGFIKQEFARLEQPFRRPKMCTVREMRRTYPGLPSYSLANLTKHFYISMERHHRALSDAKAAAELLKLAFEKDDRENAL
jgi:DNA polymerase-3 subunit epsilon